MSWLAIRRWALFICLLGSAGQPAFGHESRPGYLQLKETTPSVFEVLWRRPAKGEMVLSMQPQLPPNCAPQGPRTQVLQPGALVERWTVDCGSTGLTEQSLRIDGLELTLTDVLVRLAYANGSVYTHILKPSSTVFTINAEPSTWQMALDYGVMGVEHILGGIDHLLFVLALLIIVQGTRRLIATITAFTVAHSLTLIAATMGWVHVPIQPVEAVIALSIVLVASEILHARQGRIGITQRWPWLVAFAFGLLHGFGFAGALAEVGLPQQEVPLALLMFNVGVETGQLLFVAAVLLSLAALRRTRLVWPRWMELIPPYLIGSLAMMWLFQRIATF